MASTLTNYSTNIDTTFPVPGQDNDTQGFRDNFIAIKNSLGVASNEISDMQVVQSGIISQLGNLPIPNALNVTSLTAETITGDVTANLVNVLNTLTASVVIVPDATVTYLTVTESALIPGMLHISNTLSNALIVDGDANFNKDLYVNGTLHVTHIATNTSFSTSSSIDSTPIGVGIPASGRFTTLSAVTAQITSNLESTSRTTGALIITGGLGVAKDIHSNHVVTNQLNAGYVVALATTESNSTNSGSLQVHGGAGIAKNLVVGGNISSTGTISSSAGMYINGHAVSTVTSDLSELQTAIAVVQTEVTSLGNLVNNNIIHYHDVGAIDTAAYRINYNLGQYQKIQIDTNTQNDTTFYIDNWPVSGNYASIKVEVHINSISTATSGAYPITRTSCTTYGAVATSVDINTVLPVELGTKGIGRGWGIYDTLPITTTSVALSYVDEIVGPNRINIIPAYQFDAGTEYHFAPDPAANLPYTLKIEADGGRTLKTSVSTIFSEIVAPLFSTVVAEIYSTDGGQTQYLRQVDLYDFNQNV